MRTTPHYLLFSEASRGEQSRSTWRFVLQDVESKQRFAATDSEPVAGGERLELLAVVRGLEAIDGPARVTLVTKSRYVSRGLQQGLPDWRANEWRWERFGRSVPVRDCDLWQRVDRALLFHEVDCQSWQFDGSESTVPESPVRPPVRSASTRSLRHAHASPSSVAGRSESSVPVGHRLSRVRETSTGCNRAVRKSHGWKSQAKRRLTNWKEVMRPLVEPMRYLVQGVT